MKVSSGNFVFDEASAGDVVVAVYGAVRVLQTPASWPEKLGWA
jgi:hypothetical protein